MSSEITSPFQLEPATEAGEGHHLCDSEVNVNVGIHIQMRGTSQINIGWRGTRWMYE